MNRKVITTDNAPNAVGVYSQGIISGNLVYTSGQIALNPKTMQLVNNNIESEIRQVLNNIEFILLSAQTSIQRVIKFTVFLKKIENFSIVNDILKEYFINEYPARSIVEVSDLPLKANIEIDAIAVIE